MAKCPIKVKTSDSGDGARAQGRPPWLSPRQLAHLQGCSERTIRELCKQGVIEAERTSGRGHWRIRMPLSSRTRYELEKRRDDWQFQSGAGDLQGDFAPDLAEALVLAQLYQRDLDEDLPVQTIAEFGDPVWYGAQPTDAKACAARKIQDLIMQRMQNGKSVSDLLLTGWVYQFWHKNQRRPTVAEIAELMGLSRGGFYRRYTSADLNKNYLVVSGESERVLPDIDGLNAVERANRKAKKPGFGSFNRDPYSDD